MFRTYTIVLFVIVLGLIMSACASAPTATPIPPTATIRPPTAAPVPVTNASHIMLTPNDLKWADVPALPPGAKISVLEGSLSEQGFATVRLKFPTDYKVPPHWHPVAERVTVLSGTLNVGLGDELDTTKTMPLPAGSLMVVQPQSHHFIWTKEETMVQLNVVTPWGINYVNPADDPRKK